MVSASTFFTAAMLLRLKLRCEVGPIARSIENTASSALKSLPLSYNRDLIEDKAAAFDTVDTLALVLPAMTGMVRTMRVDVERLACAGVHCAGKVGWPLERHGERS